MPDSPVLMLALGSILFGASVGLAARSVVPDRPSTGWAMPVGVGIAGSFTGGLFANFLFGGPLLAAQTSGWIGCLLGAVATVSTLAVVVRRRSHWR